MTRANCSQSFWYNLVNVFFLNQAPQTMCLLLFTSFQRLYFIVAKGYYLWLHFFSRRKVTNIPRTPHIMLIKFLSFNHSVCQGKGQTQGFYCSMEWLLHRYVVSGSFLAEFSCSLSSLSFIFNKLLSHQTLS